MIYVNGVEESFRDESITSLLKRRSVSERGVAVALNGEVVHRGQWPSTVVGDGSYVEIVTAAAGG